MNIAVPFMARGASQPPVGVSVARDERGLESFLDPACAAAVWDRDVPQDTLRWLAGLDPVQLPSARVVVQSAAVKATVNHLCDIAEMPQGASRDWLIQDIARLAQTFAGLMQADYLRLRLQAVTTNACRKFHLDAITGRLVCTYRGTGTQYGTSRNGEDPQYVYTVPTGAPILLRGSLWPAIPSNGLLHRSPPIEGTGETRLVLVLDPVSDLERAE